MLLCFLVFCLSLFLRVFYFLFSHSSSSFLCVVRVLSSPLFSLQGDLEQLAIVPNPSAVSQQCSATRIPLVDSALLQTSRSEVSTGVRERRGRRTKGRKGVDYHHNVPAAPWKITNQIGDPEVSNSGTKKGSTTPLKKKPEDDVIKTELKDSGKSRGTTEDEDFYEDSDSEGSAQGEGQYGEDQ